MGFLFDLVVRLTGGRTLDTSDQALDSAADFQRGFETYLDLYNEYTGSSLSLEIDIQRPYDELREIDFARLSQVAEQAAELADDIDQQVEDVNTEVAAVADWTGNAASAFRGYVQQFTTATTTIEQDLGAVATATGEAVPAAQQVIAAYVEAIGDITFSDFDSPEIVALLMRVEQYALSVGDLIRELSDRLGDLLGIAIPALGGGGGGFSLNPVDIVSDVVSTVAGSLADLVLDFFGMGADQFLEWVAGKAREYLDASFRQPFDSNLQLLRDAVDAAKTGIEQAFQPVVAAAGAVNPSPFASLPVPPEDNPSQPVAPVPGPPSSGPAIPAGPSEPFAPSGPSGPAGGPAPAVGPVPSVSPVDVPSSTTPAFVSSDGGPVLPSGSTAAPTVPVDQPDLPLPSGRPDDLPPGAGWIADPSQLPPGWTVDAVTGELLPPGAPGGLGDPEVHSPQGQHILDGEPGSATGPVDLLPVTTEPGDDGPTSITLRDGDLQLTVSAGSGPDGGITITTSDAGGNQAAYTVRIGEDGQPELVPAAPDGAGPADTRAAGVGFAGFGDLATAGGPSGAASGGGSAFVPGEVSGGPSFAGSGQIGGHQDPGQAVAGTVSGGAGVGAAQLASAAGPGGPGGGPGTAQLASVGEGSAGAAAPGGAPMMPLAGAGAGGAADEERRTSGSWQLPGAEVFEADQPVGQVSGVIGEDR